MTEILLILLTASVAAGVVWLLFFSAPAAFGTWAIVFTLSTFARLFVHQRGTS